MTEWLAANGGLLGWLAFASVVMFVGSLLLVPVLVARIPADYFLRERGAGTRFSRHHPLLRLTLVVVRNLLGGVLLLAGIAMLFLPGQGVLTILIGVMLMDFPWKFELERRIVRTPTVLRSINWLRERASRPPLEVPGVQPATEPGKP